MAHWLRGLWKERGSQLGATRLEYTVMMTLVAVVLLAAAVLVVTDL